MALPPQAAEAFHSARVSRAGPAHGAASHEIARSSRRAASALDMTTHEEHPDPSGPVCRIACAHDVLGNH